MKKKITFSFLLCLWLFQGQAKDIYVSPSGNNSTGVGSISQPYLTVQRAVQAAVSGDVIILRNGTYSGSITINKTNITLRSFTGEWAVLNNPTNNSAIQQTLWFTATGGKVLDLEVVGGYYYGIKFEVGNALVSNCKIHDSGRDCIKIVPGADDITIRKCEIYNSGKRDASNAEGIDNVNADRMLVQDCYIHDIATNGLYPKGGAINCITERCLIMNCGGAGIMLGFYTDEEYLDPVQNPGWYENIDGIVRNCIIINTQGAGIGMYAALRPKVYNNTLINVANSTLAGIVSDYVQHNGANRYTTNPSIINNIITLSASSSRQVVDFRNGIQGSFTMSNNRYYDAGNAGVYRDNGINYSLASWKSHIAGDAGSTEGNPGLASNYHLATGSPCINAGATLSGLVDDYDGGIRTSLFDIGADEFGACQPLNVPPILGTIGTGINCIQNPVNNLPSVAFTLPSNNAIFITGSSVSIAVNASDTDGTISKVEFYQGSIKLGEDTAVPYTFIWSGAGSGNYILTAKAFDNTGASTTSSAVNIIITNAPSVTITSPANNSTFVIESNIEIAATATDVDGTISKVEFYQGNTKLGEDTSSPYSFLWNALSAGSYSFTAKAFDNVNVTSLSVPVAITITSPPAVVITSPADNEIITVGSNLTITAEASDADGTILKVEFYEGANKLGEDLSSPYTTEWNSLAEGAYVLTAKAFDNTNSITTSLPINITVTSATQSLTLEAENAIISQGILETLHGGYTGTAYVNYNNVTGSYVEWTANVPAQGNYSLQFRYANGTLGDRPAEILINGIAVNSALSFPSTNIWENWQLTEAINVALNVGDNTIRVRANTSSGGANIDHLTLDLISTSFKVSVNSDAVYPNPVSSTLYVDLENADAEVKIQLVNINGHTVPVQHTIENNKIVINTASVKTGQYILTIFSGRNLVTKRTVIIQQ